MSPSQQKFFLSRPANWQTLRPIDLVPLVGMLVLLLLVACARGQVLPPGMTELLGPDTGASLVLHTPYAGIKCNGTVYVADPGVSPPSILACDTPSSCHIFTSKVGFPVSLACGPLGVVSSDLVGNHIYLTPYSGGLPITVATLPQNTVPWQVTMTHSGQALWVNFGNNSPVGDAIQWTQQPLSLTPPFPAVVTLAGTGQWNHTGDGGPPNLATFKSPSGVAIDTIGDIFVAEQASWIRVVQPGVSIATIMGNGFDTNSGDGGKAIAAAIGAPSTLAFSPVPGTLFIASRSHGLIRAVANADTAKGGGVVSTLVDLFAVFGTHDDVTNISVDYDDPSKLDLTIQSGLAVYQMAIPGAPQLSTPTVTLPTIAPATSTPVPTRTLPAAATFTSTPKPTVTAPATNTAAPDPTPSGTPGDCEMTLEVAPDGTVTGHIPPCARPTP